MKQLKLTAVAALCIASSLRSQNDSINKMREKEKERPFQFTFVTPVGTNGIECFKITNRVSLNMLFGVSRGVHGFEASGIGSIVRKDMKGFQIAGVTNIVLGEVKGTQIGYGFNYSGKDFTGAAFAAGCNFNMGKLRGGQFSAGLNFNKGGGRGVQVGAANISLGDFKGAQIAYGVNIATGTIDGAQVSAGFNYAKKVKGIQLGYVNVADTVDGASIGLFSFVRKGKHQIEFSGDELFYTNLSYRTGTNTFYNIFSLGYQPGSKDNLWHLGYGAGTSFRIKGKLRSEVSFTAHHVNTGGFYWGTSELLRLYCGVEYIVAKKFSIAAGPTFNLFMSDVLLSDYLETRKDLAPYHSYDHTTRYDFNLKGWVGGRIALRFL